MKSLLFTNLLSLSLLLFNFSVVAQAKPSKPICDYPVEAASETTKMYVYPKFGVSVEMPDNLVSMLRVNGEIEILDRGTYRVLQCPPDQREGRGYTSFILRWADKTIYSRTDEIKDNVYLLMKADKYDDEYFYTMVIRIIGSKGQRVDLFINEDNQIDKYNFEEYLKEYIDLARKVSILSD